MPAHILVQLAQHRLLIALPVHKRMELFSLATEAAWPILPVQTEPMQIQQHSTARPAHLFALLVQPYPIASPVPLVFI